MRKFEREAEMTALDELKKLMGKMTADGVMKSGKLKVEIEKDGEESDGDKLIEGEQEEEKEHGIGAGLATKLAADHLRKDSNAYGDESPEHEAGESKEFEAGENEEGDSELDDELMKKLLAKYSSIK